MDLTDVIVKPIITEQSMDEVRQGKFTFLVSRSADKTKIKRAVEGAFDVKVKHVVTTVLKGRTKRVGTRRSEVVLAPMKKATVILMEGQKISLFETAA